MANALFAGKTRRRGKTGSDKRELAAGSIIVSSPFSVFWFRDIFCCADWPGCESAPVRSFEFRSLPVRSPSWGYSSENEIVAHRDRTKFVHPIHNRADPSESQAWRSLPPYQDPLPVICRRQFSLPTRSRALPASCKHAPRLLPPTSAARLRVTASPNLTV